MRLRAAAAGLGVVTLAVGAFVVQPLAAADPAPIHVVTDGEVIYVPPGVTGWSIVSGTPPPEVSPSPSNEPSATPTATPTLTPIPTASPTATPTATPTTAPTITPTATPTTTPTATPPAPSPTPPPTGDYILIPKEDLLDLPTTGAAWGGVLTQAAKTPDIDLSDLNADGDVVTLAKALVYARTGDATRRAQVVTALQQVQLSGVDRALELGRGVGAYVLAADLIGYRDPAFVAWAGAQRTRGPLPGGPTTLVACQEQRPNNWGGWCGASRIAIDLYIGDATDLARAIAVFRGYLGDLAQYAGFRYGELSWQANSSAPVGINPVGAVKSGHSIDGVLPDDQRRAGSFSWPPPCENYVWEGLAGYTLQATLLDRAGYPAWTWSDAALRRALTWLHSQANCPATGDDTGTPWAVNHGTGSSFPAITPSAPSKGWGYQDWLFQ